MEPVQRPLDETERESEQQDVHYADRYRIDDRIIFILIKHSNRFFIQQIYREFPGV
jgi:hypothetical protein